jgi:hypothetical protein
MKTSINFVFENRFFELKPHTPFFRNKIESPFHFLLYPNIIIPKAKSQFLQQDYFFSKNFLFFQQKLKKSRDCLFF